MVYCIRIADVYDHNAPALPIYETTPGQEVQVRSSVKYETDPPCAENAYLN